jgi:large subunit ribosomal protein L10
MAKAQKRMTRARKEHDLADLRDKLERSSGVVLTDFSKLTVSEISDLRRRLGKAGIDYRVSKNRLIKLAVREANYEDVSPMLVGATALAFTYDEPTQVAKMLIEFAKENEKLSIKGGYLGKRALSESSIRQLATVPSRSELLTRLAGSLKSPVASLVYVLKGTASGLVTVVAAIARQAEQQEGT